MVRRMASIAAQGIGFAVVGLLALQGALGLLQGELPWFHNLPEAGASSAGALPSPLSLDPTLQELAPSQREAPAATSESPMVEGSMPLLISYHGALPDSEGQASGTYTMTFRIYASVADPVGRKLWTEQHSAVALREGYFSEPTWSEASYGLSRLVP